MNRSNFFLPSLVARLMASVMVAFVLLAGCGQKAADADAQILNSSDVMPRFPGCEELNLPDDEARYRCSLQSLMNYLGAKITYPEEAKKKGTTGEAVVQFIVKVDGSIEFVRIIEDPGDGLGEEAARQVKRMIDEGVKWRPGYQEGKPVSVRFNLPVNFNLPRDPDTGKALE